MDERRVPRTAICLAATLRREKIVARQVTILDFTRFGCRLAVDGAPSPGSFVTLNIPAFAEIGGWIAWTKAGEVGIDFAHPLPTAVATHIVALGQGRVDDGHDPAPSDAGPADGLVRHLPSLIVHSPTTPIYVAA